jgi:hypothetical protein
VCAFVPAKAAATSPQTIYPVRQTAAEDAFDSNAELLAMSRNFQEQVPVQAKGLMG